ncbi:alpha/beta fold hydrolase [Kitasatospora sp. LaBMicrA B282]|uniref:alpha/beta fold hydrolase n=1 Tax=Kitasatospora sp. LaBMicrA B282 TaxID=3420949 RepID=UPI003D0D442D
MSLDRRRVLALGAGAAAVFTAMDGVAFADDGSAPEPAGRLSARDVPSDAELACSLPGGFRSDYADVNGTRLHYVAGGRGEPLVLLPGWPETWWADRKILPILAQRYRVIAVDARGQGGSARPEGGYDKKTMARDVYELVRGLGYRSVNIAGHDIGAMVAYSFAANHPDATRALAMLDVVHPDDSLYQLPMLLPPNAGFNMWWFAFNQVVGLPQDVMAGRFWRVIEWLYDNSLYDQSHVTELDRAVYSRAYDNRDGIRASCGWYQALNQDIADMRTYDKVSAPVIGLACPSEFDRVQSTLQNVTTDLRGMVQVSKSMHWLAEDDPELVSRTLTNFFG